MSMTIYSTYSTRVGILLPALPKQTSFAFCCQRDPASIPDCASFELLLALGG